MSKFLIIKLIFIILTTLIGISLFFGVQDKKIEKSVNHEVFLTENGFEPKEINVNIGDTVVFKTKRGKSFWPASNVHPTHDIYPEFDSKKPIDKNKSWSFTFIKEGTWSYHDHISPYYNGKIVVGQSKKKTSSSNCDSLKNNEQLQCWENLIDTEISKNGVDSAFDLMTILYDKYPYFAVNCHGFVHQLGSSAYELFVKNKKFKISTKTSYCNYGFYHGFISTLLEKSKDYKKATEFCSLVEEQLRGISRDAVFQCYHGIGHGAVATDDTKLWGNEQAMIKPALQICEEMFSDAEQQYRCTSGIYNGIANFYLKKEFNLKINENDPLWICRVQKDKYKDACYGQMTTVIYSIKKNNFLISARFIEGIKDDGLAKSTITYLSNEHARNKIGKEIDYDLVVQDCNKLQTRLRFNCIIGFSNGLIDQGKPEEEYIPPFELCSSRILDENTEKQCFRHVFSYLVNVYTKDKFSSVCKIAKEKYGQDCKK